MTMTGYFALYSVFAPVWLADATSENDCVKRIKIDTYSQRCKSPEGTLVSGIIRFVRIFAGVL